MHFFHTFYIFLSGWRIFPDFYPEQAPFELINSQDSPISLIELQVFPLLINFSNISPLKHLFVQRNLELFPKIVYFVLKKQFPS